MILDKSPIDYQAVLTNMQIIKESLDKEATLHYIEDSMDNHSRNLSRDHKTVNDGSELSLHTVIGKFYLFNDKL